MLQVIKRLSIPKADFLGMSASVLCMIHCLAVPLFVSLGFIVKNMDGHAGHHHHDHEHGYFHFHWDWHMLDYLFILLALVAVFQASKQANSRAIKLALWMSVSIFSVAILLHDLHNSMLFVSLGASLALFGTHIVNWKTHKKCNI
ncbi:MerC domain-containing protein [Mongoliitalea lutea]|nr:MerC domain-containing protein [Mongoliitalea lutea]